GRHGGTLVWRRVGVKPACAVRRAHAAFHRAAMAVRRSLVPVLTIRRDIFDSARGVGRSAVARDILAAGSGREGGWSIDDAVAPPGTLVVCRLGGAFGNLARRGHRV